MKNVSLLGTQEQAELLDIGSNTRRDYPDTQTMVSLFVEQAKSNPKRVALECSDGQSYDYATLDSWSNQLARHLLDRGYADESSRVGVYLERDVLMVVALLAVMKSGAAYVPMDPLFPVERLMLMAEDAQLSVVLTQQALMDSVPGTGAVEDAVVTPVPLDIADAPWRACSQEPVCHAQASHTAYVIYTSGSTVGPKGCRWGIAR